MSPIDGDADDAQRSPGQPIKRAQVVYGRRSTGQPLPSPVVSTDEQEQSLVHDRVHRARALSSRRRTSPSSVHTSDSGRPRTPDAPGHFQFGFRHKLKELDQQFNDPQPPKPDLSFDNNAISSGSSHAKDPQSVSMGTASLSPQGRRPSPPSSPLGATSPRGLPPESTPVRRHTREVLNPDFEVEGPTKSSSVTPVRHAITTPHSRSSPTPPTSGDVPMVGRKSKGKAPARDVLPLRFDAERPLAAEVTTKSKKGRRSESLSRSKTKAPTKKDRREAVFESSRIAASRPVEVLRTQEQKHSLPAFFANLYRDNIMSSTLGTELPSDPIERFSSPTDRSMQLGPPDSVFGAPVGFLATSTHAGTAEHTSPSGTTKTLAPAAPDSDDDMPSVASIIQQASVKQQKLQAMKQVALQCADTRVTDDDDEDDDLLVVKDDMHTVAREAAAQRRLDKAHGSPVKNLSLLRRINHPSIRPVATSPRKLSKQELQEHAKPSFAHSGKGAKGRLSKKQLDLLMITQHNEDQTRSIKRLEEEWVSRGGKLLRDASGGTTQTLSQTLEAYAEQGLRAVQVDATVGDEDSGSGSDEDYIPDMQGSESPEPAEDNDVPDDAMEVSQDLRPPEDDEDEVIALRRNRQGQRRPRNIVGSDDEEQPVQRILPNLQRDSTSSMESQTEDENDKENSAKLMYDRSEDKENKATVRHELITESLAGSRMDSLYDGSEKGAQRDPSATPDTGFDDTVSPKGDGRSPLKDISREEDDLFLSLPSKPPFTDRLLQSATISPPRTSAPTLSLTSSPVLRSERISRIERFSLPENDSPSELKTPSFLERLQSQISPGPFPASLNPIPVGGFTQLFSAEDSGLTRPADRADNDGLSLTLDVGLKPALEVSSALRQKAEAIFEKEQEYVVAAAVKQNDGPKQQLYVNDHGFLTQTRPEDSSPQIYRFTPSQASKFAESQVYTTQTQPLGERPPLRTLSFTASQELSPEPKPLRRLRKRSSSPLAHKAPERTSNSATKLNAFDVLGKSLQPQFNTQEKNQKSEFVAVEAEESDEDDMFGFGGPKRQVEEDDEEEEGDKVIEGLVDDAHMDVETEAAHLVQEKHREHEEEDDQRLQKYHQDAVEGKLRMKRRDRGVGFEDDSDEDDDDEERRIRQRMHKKRKIDGDNLEALGQNEATRAFYNTYHQDLMDEDDDFGYLRGDLLMPQDDVNPQAEEPEEQETVTVDEIRQRVRELAQSNHEVETLDPEDISWVDKSMIADPDDTVSVRVVECQSSRPMVRHPTAGRMDFDAERPMRLAESEQERKQMTSWAKDQSYQRLGTGRSGNASAVTGHTNAKSGGGSLRSARPSGLVAESTARKIKSSSSVLSVVSDRSSKFT